MLFFLLLEEALQHFNNQSFLNRRQGESNAFSFPHCNDDDCEDASFQQGGEFPALRYSSSIQGMSAT